MSVEAVSWALRVPIGGNAKVILLGLANHAHPDGTHAFPAIDTLAVYAACDRRTVQRNLRQLEEAKWIACAGHVPSGAKSWALAMGRQIATPGRGGEDATPGAARASRGGGADAALTVPNRSTPTAAGAGARGELPDDFPDELLEHLRHVYRVLRDVARRVPGAREPKPLALANVVMARPRYPLVRAAHDYAAWALGQSRRRHKDVVAGYRNWLDKTDELAATEPLPGEAAPAASANGGGKPWSGALRPVESPAG